MQKLSSQLVDLLKTRNIILFLIIVGSFIFGSSLMLSYYAPIEKMDKTSVLAIAIFENSVIAISSILTAIIVTMSVVKRNNEHHFINMPSLSFAACLFYGGAMMIMEIVTLKYKFWWLAIVLRLVVAGVFVFLAVGIVKHRKFLDDLPDVSQLLTTIQKLQNRIDVLKSTNPYVDAEGFTSGEKLDLEILKTLKKVTTFLETFEKPTDRGK